MPSISEILTSYTFLTLQVGISLRTPDRIKSSSFTVKRTTNNSIIIQTKTTKSSPIPIKRCAFLETLKYLLQNGHSKFKKIKIQSSNDPKKSGHLCEISRKANNNTRCINYILPILEHLGFIGIDGNKPNKTWYI